MGYSATVRFIGSDRDLRYTLKGASFVDLLATATARTTMRKLCWDLTRASVLRTHIVLRRDHRRVAGVEWGLSESWDHFAAPGVPDTTVAELLRTLAMQQYPKALRCAACSGGDGPQSGCAECTGVSRL